MTRTDFQLHERRDRLAGLLNYATGPASGRTLRGLARQIDAARHACDGPTEVSLILAFQIALRDDGLPEGDAWLAWQGLRRTFVEAAHREGRPALIYQNSDQAQVFLSNWNYCMRDLRRIAPNDPLRIHLLLSSVLTGYGLLWDYVWKQAFGPLKENPVLAMEVGPAIKDFVNLSWHSVPLRFGTVRNAWAHGDAELTDEGLVVYEESGGKKLGTLSVGDLEQYVRASQATWHAFQFDLVLLAAFEERTTGQPIRFEKEPPRSGRAKKKDEAARP